MELSIKFGMELSFLEIEFEMELSIFEFNFDCPPAAPELVVLIAPPAAGPFRFPHT